MTWEQLLTNAAAGAGGVLIGVGIAWGTIRTQVRQLTDEVRRQEACIITLQNQFVSILTAISELRGRVDTYIEMSERRITA